MTSHVATGKQCLCNYCYGNYYIQVIHVDIFIFIFIIHSSLSNNVVFDAGGLSLQSMVLWVVVTRAFIGQFTGAAV